METASLRNNTHYSPLYWIAISLLILIADYFSGPFIQFPITYLIPISLASWYSGRRWGLALSIIMPFVRLFYNLAFWTVPWTAFDASINCIIRITVFCIFSTFIYRSATRTKELFMEVNLLTGLLPICSFCKKIRDDKNKWQPIETYVSKRSEATFTHGVCPECAEKHYGFLLKKK